MGQRQNEPTRGKGAHLTVHTPTGNARMDADQNIMVWNKEEPQEGRQEAGRPMDGTRQEAASARRNTG